MNESNSSAGLNRRAVVKGMAWSVPVVAVAVKAPLAAASGEVITGGDAPVVDGVCTVVGDFTFTVTDAGAPVVGRTVTVTLPAGFEWADGTTGAKSLVTNGLGVVTISGVKAANKPGHYAVTATIAGGGVASVPVNVPGAWHSNGWRPGSDDRSLARIYFDPATTSGLSGTPDAWAYCIEPDINDIEYTNAYLTEWDDFLGSGIIATDSSSWPKLTWISANGFPSKSLAELDAAAGVTGATEEDAARATRMAFWSISEYGDGIFRDDDDELPTPQAKAIYAYLYDTAVVQTSIPACMGPVLLSVANNLCDTPTPGNHAQTYILMKPAC